MRLGMIARGPMLPSPLRGGAGGEVFGGPNLTPRPPSLRGKGERSAGLGLRKGLSLLEVLAALAIFLLALIGIGRLLTLSGERALEVQQQSRAAQLCQAKLAEVVAGVISLSSQSGAFDEDPGWQWSVDAQSDSISGLWRVKVTVSRDRPDGSRIESSLNQMVLDPSLRGSTTDTASAASASSNSSSGAGSGTAGGGSSGQGGAAGGGAMPTKPPAAKASGSGATTPKGGSPGPAASPGTSKQKPGG